MPKRSLIASPSGRLLAKQSFQRTGWTQEYLAYQAGLETRQPVWKFFSGRPVERHVFIEICFQLNLDWEDIAEGPDIGPDIGLEPGLDLALDASAAINAEPSVYPDAAEFADLKAKVRPFIERRCGSIQAPLEASNALPLSQLYTDVKVLPYLAQQRWLEVSDLSRININLQPLRLNEPSTVSTPALSVAESQTRLMLIGKPGAGKTTFLRYLALQCVNGHFRADCIPMFVNLRTWIAASNLNPSADLTEALEAYWAKDGLPTQAIAPLLQAGKLLVLLDGLDEVGTADLPILKDCLQRFAERYHQSPIIITSRIASIPFTLPLFHYAEVADLTQSQIECSVERYFTAAVAQDHALAHQFLVQLAHPNNAAIRELATTPILLHLLCRVFQDRKTFPVKRVKLYQAGLEMLVMGWDQVRGTHRSSMTDTWSVADKLKLLSHLAAHFFEQERYFFDKNEVVQFIAQYLQAETTAPMDREQLWFLSEGILRVFETQHGLLVQRAHNVYSFSHLTFQEYLTARKIAATPEHRLPEVLQQLVQHGVQHGAQQGDVSYWREVISMTSGLLHQPQLLLEPLLQTIQQNVDKIPEIQPLVAQVQQKIKKLAVNLNPTALRLFYVALSRNWGWGTAIASDPRIAQSLSDPLGLDPLDSDPVQTRLFPQCDRVEAEVDYRAILNLYSPLDLEPKPLSLAPESVSESAPESEWRSQWQVSTAQLAPLNLEKDHLLAWWNSSGTLWRQQFFRLLADRCFGVAEPLSGELGWQLVSYYKSLQLFMTCLQEATLRPELRRQLQDQVLQSIDPSIDLSINPSLDSDPSTPPPLKQGKRQHAHRRDWVMPTAG